MQRKHTGPVIGACIKTYILYLFFGVRRSTSAISFVLTAVWHVYNTRRGVMETKLCCLHCRHTLVCSALPSTPTGGCQSTLTMSYRSITARRGQRCLLICSLSLTTPTETCCRVSTAIGHCVYVHACVLLRVRACVRVCWINKLTVLLCVCLCLCACSLSRWDNDNNSNKTGIYKVHFPFEILKMGW